MNPDLLPSVPGLIGAGSVVVALVLGVVLARQGVPGVTATVAARRGRATRTSHDGTDRWVADLTAKTPEKGAA